MADPQQAPAEPVAEATILASYVQDAIDKVFDKSAPFANTIVLKRNLLRELKLSSE